MMNLPPVDKSLPRKASAEGSRFDVIVVGLGLAGVLLTHQLLKEGRSVLVVDAASEHAASRVAAGIINPITGRRFVKSWRIEELLPAARQTYRELEELLDVKLYYERGLIRSIFHPAEENDWLSRSGDPSYEPFLADRAELGAWASAVAPARAYGEIRQAAQVDLPLLVNRFRNYLLDQNRLLEEKFDYPALSITENGLQYQGLEAAQLVFCEGYWMHQNPYFNYLPFRGDKGEVILVRILGLEAEKILKHQLFITPLPDKHYWIGASYLHQYHDPSPSEQGREDLTRRLKDILFRSFEVEAHLAAVRPTVADRRPFLGRHPKHPQLAIFNGLGTKGTSLGPFFARQMADVLLNRRSPDPAVDIARFAPVEKS